MHAGASYVALACHNDLLMDGLLHSLKDPTSKIVGIHINVLTDHCLQELSRALYSLLAHGIVVDPISGAVLEVRGDPDVRGAACDERDTLCCDGYCASQGTSPCWQHRECCAHGDCVQALQHSITAVPHR